MRNYTLNLFTQDIESLQAFLDKYYENNIKLESNKFEKEYGSPIDMIEIISTLIDNNEKYPAGIWISIDKDIYINVTELNLDKIIRYLYERYPNY